MPEKSVREMNALERKHYSLAARTFHATVMGAAILGLVALFIGLGLYTYALTQQYISEAFNLSRNAAGILEKVVDTHPLSDEVMRRYQTMTEDERSQVGTAAYRERFADLQEREDYQTIRSILADFRETSDVYDVYLAMYDRDTSAMVYIADPDDSEFFCAPVDWEGVERKEMERFLAWNGTGRLYDIGQTEKYGWLCTSGVPLKSAAGEVDGFVLADVTLGNIASGMKNFLLQYTIAMALAVFVLGYFLTKHMKKTLVEPINAITEAAVNYVQDKRSGAGMTDRFSMLNIRTGDEVENLSLVMADMERDLSEYEENLTQAISEKERVGAELSLATRIQADMLPNIFPAFPERPDFDIFASMTPAKEVGGDFYDFFLIDENHLGLVMADVSGKGVPAALFMMASKILVQNYTMSERSPAKVLQIVNDQICSNNREEMFVTVWLGILDMNNGKLVAANAGHEYPILKRPGGSFELVKDKHGFVIGGLAGVKYREYELQLEPGAKLFLYTDGVPEATDANNRLFGMERTLEALNRRGEGSPMEILTSVNEAVNAFVGDAPQFDDLTMMCVQFIGKESSRDGTEGGTHVKELTVAAKVESITEVTDFVNAELEAVDCPLKAQMQVDVAIDEILGNIAHYAYGPEGGSATVRVEILEDPRAVDITFLDRGVPYDPLAKEDPDTSLSAPEREIGGLGIFLVKKTMDEMQYSYQDGQNILRIRKLFA